MKDEYKEKSLSKDTGNMNPNTKVKEALSMKREILMDELKKIDSAIAQLQAEFSKKLDKLQAQRKPSEEALHHVDALLRLEGHILNSNQKKTNEPNASSVVGTAHITDAAYNLLEEIHKPMHYKEIVTKLQEGGIYIPGKNPAATLLSRMIRDDRFKRIKKRGTYALSTWRIRAAKSKRRKRVKKKKIQ